MTAPADGDALVARLRAEVEGMRGISGTEGLRETCIAALDALLREVERMIHTIAELAALATTAEAALAAALRRAEALATALREYDLAARPAPREGGNRG
jgi:hypothetical protein